MKKFLKKNKLILQILLIIGALFYLSEFFFHFFGITILEHNKIFMPTHDRYIALYGLTYAVLLALVSTDLEKYKTLFLITMAGIFLGYCNAVYISYSGGYDSHFTVSSLDNDLSWLGYSIAAWYIMTGVSWFLYNKK